MDKTRPNAGHRPLIDLDGLDLKGKTVLCAVSGGADSVALLCLLAEERDKGTLALYAAHFEHGIRGEASLQDMEFVTGLCTRLGVPLSVKRANVPKKPQKGTWAWKAAPGNCGSRFWKKNAGAWARTLSPWPTTGGTGRKR